MSLQVADLLALASATTPKYGRNKCTDLASDLTEYIFMKKLFNEHSTTFSSGDEYRFNVTKALGGNARNIGMFEKDLIGVTDSHGLGVVQWKFTQCSTAYDIKEKIFNSGSAEQILDEVKLRKARDRAALVVFMEEQFWVNQATTSNLAPFGVDYWLPSVASGYTDIDNHGLIGGDPSGFSSGAGGLAVADYPMYQNWAGNYTAVSKADLIKKMRRAYEKTNFISPLNFPDYNDQSTIANRFQIYINLATKESIEDVGESQNENLGRDVASMDSGSMAFRGCPFVYVPKLDHVSGNPIRMMNWGTFKLAVNKGLYLKETTRMSPASVDVVQTVTEIGWNSVCEDRKLNAVLTTVV